MLEIENKKMSDTAQHESGWAVVLAVGCQSIWGGIRLYATVCTFVLIAFFNGLGGELVGDSRELFSGNELIQKPWGIWDIWTSNYWGNMLYAGNYRPVSTWSYALNYRFNGWLGLGPLDAWTYRLVNIALHAGVVCALFFLAGLLGLGWRGKWLACLGFAWHPLHVEAVASAVGRADVLAALFGLVFLYMHWHGRHPWWAGAALLIALWAKESGLAFIAVALWMDWCWRRNGSFAYKKNYVKYGIYIAIWFFMRHLALGGREAQIAALDNPLVIVDGWSRLLTAIAIQVEYVKRLLWPFSMSTDYSHAQFMPIDSWMDWRLVAAALAFACFLYLGYRRGAQHPVLIFAAGAYVLLAMPTANIFVVIGTIMGERLTYAPSIMAALIWGLMGEKLMERWPGWGTGLGLCFLAAWCLLSIDRSGTWGSREIYHRTQVQTAPQSARAHFGMGAYHLVRLFEVY